MKSSLLLAIFALSGFSAMASDLRIGDYLKFQTGYICILAKLENSNQRLGYVKCNSGGWAKLTTDMGFEKLEVSKAYPFFEKKVYVFGKPVLSHSIVAETVSGDLILENGRREYSLHSPEHVSNPLTSSFGDYGSKIYKVGSNVATCNVEVYGYDEANQKVVIDSKVENISDYRPFKKTSSLKWKLGQPVVYLAISTRSNYNYEAVATVEAFTEDNNVILRLGDRMCEVVSASQVLR